MGRVDRLYKKKNIFNELFGSLCFEVETSYYDASGDYLCFYVIVKSKIDFINEEIIATVTSIKGNINRKIERFFKANIPPQKVNKQCQITLLQEDASEILFSDDWNLMYPDLLMDAMEETLRTIKVRDEHGYPIYLPLKIRDIYLEE
ncbi:hypothetical protein PU629_10725 [Pullulanibacillus sp. KACC 23026]|uniref:hypothetical protein n=1 Tax=Pullulanibacillus sp. KACC 23026 TaxID=3028315 RepID=UPI0023B172AB|nr:hypothetical protein [Pullulanibacillus sp. KACC 23026]WEG14785.1 hypothetical protein PU629_10725 [Pullulanibacillus sp. KACC 23026]